MWLTDQQGQWQDVHLAGHLPCAPPHAHWRECALPPAGKVRWQAAAYAERVGPNLRAWNLSRKRGFLRKWKSKIAEKKKISVEKQIDKHTFFFQTVRRCSKKYGNHAVNECEFASKNERWWSYRSWTFAYFKLFPWRKYRAGPDWSKKFVKPMTIDFAFKLNGS